MCGGGEKKVRGYSTVTRHQALRQDRVSVYFALGRVLDSLEHLYPTLYIYPTTRTPLFAATGSHRLPYPPFLFKISFKRWPLLLVSSLCLVGFTGCLAFCGLPLRLWLRLWLSDPVITAPFTRLLATTMFKPLYPFIGRYGASVLVLWVHGSY